MGNANDLLNFLNSQESQRTGKAVKPIQSNPTKFPKTFTPVGKVPAGGRFVLPNTQHLPPPPAPSHGGGGVGGALHSIGSWFGGAAHQAAHYSDLAAHDIAAMPAGVVKAGEVLSHDAAKLGNRIPGASSTYTKRADKTPWETPILGKAIYKSTKDSLAHPGRDPFQTLLTVGSIASLGAGAVARGAAAADALSGAEDLGLAGRAGEVAKALAKKPRMSDRIFTAPKIVKGKNGGLYLKQERVQLTASQNPLIRAAQHLHDQIVERHLRNTVEANGNRVTAINKPSVVARYGEKRIGRSVDEITRRAENTRMTLPVRLDRYSLGKLRHFGKGLNNKEGNLAIFLRSANVMPHEAGHFWSQIGEHTGDPVETDKLAKLAYALHQKGALTVGPDRTVQVNENMFPKLKHIDNLVKEAQGTRAGVIEAHDLMSPEAMRERLNLVAEKMGLSNRQGQGYTDLSVSEKNLARYPRSGSVPVTGKTKSFIRKTVHATGEGILTGRIPDNTVHMVSRSLRQALQYVTKVEHREMVAKYGSDVRRSNNDVLIADPSAPGYANHINAHTREILDQQKPTLNTIDEHQSMQDRVKAALSGAMPHLDPNHEYNATWQAAHKIGAEAPKGYKWVSERMIGDLAKSVAPRGKFARGADAVNSAITAATVYFKLSHVPQRAVTDATTSLISGALLDPKTVKFARELRQKLSTGDYMRAAQTTGTHGYAALPHEGTTMGARAATAGANFYARHVDTWFRFQNLAHEARKAGLDTPDKFKKLLDYAENPSHGGKLATTYEQVLRRANRTSMMYDGLTPTERAVFSRILWFYPWTKAAFRYAGHVAAEHPMTTLGGINAGVQGREWQQKELGRQPSFEYGMIPFAGGHITSNAGWLTPFNTASQVAEWGARPQQIAQSLNPAAGAALTATTGLNGFGETAGHPIGTALSELFAPTPEASTLNDFLHAKETQKSFHLFPHPPWYDLLTRFVVGPTMPKTTNKKALHRFHDREAETGKYNKNKYFPIYVKR